MSMKLLQRPVRFLHRSSLCLYFLAFLSFFNFACEKNWDKATVSELMEALDDPDPWVRSRAASELRLRGDAVKEAIPRLIEALSDPDVQVRWMAAWTLSEMEPAPPLSAMPAFLSLLRNPESAVAHESAATALGRMGPAAIPGLIESFGQNSSTGSRAARALAMIGAPAIPPLVEVLTHGNDAVRRHAAWAFQKMGAGAKPALEHLLNALGDSDPFVRECMAETLGTIGSAAGIAAPELQRLLEDPQERVREAARTALRQIQAQP
jgi:HEAT repeat protein